MDIVEELRQHRESGAKRLEAEYKAGLMTLACRFCNNSSDAEELVNRTFAAVVAGIDDYLEQSAFFGWMCQILKNIHSLDRRRKSNRNEIYPGKIPDFPDDVAEETIYRDLDRTLVREALETLDASDREVLVLRYFLEVPVAKMAKVLAIPSGTVKSRLHYARLALAAKLGVAAKKPGVKVLLIALAFAAITAVGAAVAVVSGALGDRALPAGADRQAARTEESEADEPSALRQDAAQDRTGETEWTEGTGEASAPNAASLPSISSVLPALSFFEQFSSTTQPPTKEQTMNTATLRTFAASAAFAAASAAEAKIKLPQLDSSEFTHKYEMEMPLTSEDVDGDGFADFTTNNCPIVSSHYGVCDYTFVGFCMSQTDSDAGSAWRRFVQAAGEGYTIELRMKLNYKSTAATYAMALSASDGSNCDMCLGFKDNGLTWNETSITNMATTDVFHTYRVAKIPNEARFVLWCDGVLVRDNLGDALVNDGLNRLLLGAIGGKYGGRTNCSYLRFTKGAYAPKRGGKDSSEFAHRYEMDSSDTRFSPTGNASDWTLGSGESGSAALVNGILSIDQPRRIMRYYATVDPMDSSISASSPFTLETRVRMGNAWDETAGRVLSFYCGTPRFTAQFFIGTNTVSWSSSYTVLHTGDNTDKMHVFRVTYEGDRQDGFTLWRDGEKVGENLTGTTAYNHARFGIASTSTHGGSFEMDYIRWTTDGVYEPFVPSPAFVLILR